MYYLIGTDEAGYGPNLGPLAVTATLWQVEDDSLEPETLFEALQPAITNTARKGNEGKIPIADSKKLHRHDSLEPLEKGVFAALNVLGQVTREPIDSSLLYDLFCGSESLQERKEVPWNTPETEEKLPRNLHREKVPLLGKILSEAMNHSGVHLRGIRSVLVFPERFNDGVEACGSKGIFLSDTTMQLIVSFWNELSTGTFSENFITDSHKVRVFCDKHGGRNFYLPTLMEFFPGLPFCIVNEGRAFSEYIHYGERLDLQIRFQAKGETLLPVALASMVSKYLREISMNRLNTWWSKIIPGIRPTAGYPEDAKRFRAEISEKMKELDLDWRKMWRNR